MIAQEKLISGETSVLASRQNRCPVCNSTAVALRSDGGLPVSETTRNYLFRQNAYRIMECGACAFVFKDSILDNEQFARLYADIDYTRWECKGLYPTERRVVRILSELRPGSRILDFGCSSGRLMGELVGRHECFGFEINQDAATDAAARGVKVVGSVDEFPALAGTMDAVVLVDVFEHLENPLPVLQTLTALLKPGGLLIVVTGDADCPAANPDLANFWYFRNIQHIGMLTRRHAEYLARKLSLTLERWSTVSHYDVSPLELFLQHSRHFVFRQIHRRPDSPVVGLLGRLPVIGRCAAWRIPPPFSASKDHAVAVWRKQGNTAAASPKEKCSL